MRRRSSFIAPSFLGAVALGGAACSLVASLDGLTGGPIAEGPGVEAGVDATAAGTDGGVDGGGTAAGSGVAPTVARFQID